MRAPLMFQRHNECEVPSLIYWRTRQSASTWKLPFEEVAFDIQYLSPAPKPVPLNISSSTFQSTHPHNQHSSPKWNADPPSPKKQPQPTKCLVPIHQPQSHDLHRTLHTKKTPTDQTRASSRKKTKGLTVVNCRQLRRNFSMTREWAWGQRLDGHFRMF